MDIYGQVQIRIQIVGARIYQTIFSKVLNISDQARVLKMIEPEENMLKISWRSGVPSRSYEQ